MASGDASRLPSRVAATAAVIVLTGAFAILSAHDARAASKVKSDPPLLNALRSDAELRRCACIRAAIWVNESYPRVTVDAGRWKHLRGPERTRFNARALKVAEATYLIEFAASDQYEEIFIVDERGKLLASYRP
ncbi:MAG: hypothetical protein NVSMB19_09280 [Vulcanimicrobiaceae bacterium]